MKDQVLVPGVPLTTAAVARRAGRSEATIRSWIRDGRLKPMATTSSGVRLFSPEEVDRAAQESGR